MADETDDDKFKFANPLHDVDGGSPVVVAKPVVAKKASKKKGGNIFDRLTDTKLYTGAHKHRFNADGSGRGKAGRTSAQGVSDISQLTRTNLR